MREISIPRKDVDAQFPYLGTKTLTIIGKSIEINHRSYKTNNFLSMASCKLYLNTDIEQKRVNSIFTPVR